VLDPTPIDRSAFLRTALAGVAALAVGNTSGLGARFVAIRGETPSRSAVVSSRRKVLLAYFSRPGENYYGGRIDRRLATPRS
jgi:hypothetical protein